MDQSEQSQQAGGAVQMGAKAPPPLDDIPYVVATSSKVNAPVSPTMQPPPPPPPVVSTDQHQLAYQLAQAQHLDQVRERLRQFWANRMQEVQQTDLKNHNLPISVIKRIMKADKDVRMVSRESPALLAKACEMFIVDLTSRAWINTEESARRTVQKKDIAEAIYKTDIFDFLEEIMPRDDELKKQILKSKNATLMQQVGSSAGPSNPNKNVAQQSSPFMPLYDQPPPENQQNPGQQQNDN